MRELATEVVAKLSTTKPSTRTKALGVEWTMHMILARLTMALPRLRAQAKRQTARKRRIFRARARKATTRLRIVKVKQSEVKKRIAARREEERKRLAAPDAEAVLPKSLLAKLDAQTSAAAGPRIPLRDPLGRQLPRLQNIERRSSEQLIRTLRRVGATPDVARLRAAARQAQAQVIKAKTPDVATVNRAIESVERAIKRELVREMKDYTRRAEMEAAGLRGRGTKRVPATWVAVGDEKTCPSCDARDGVTKQMRAWGDGVPGSADLVCDGNCRCILLPDAWFEPAAMKKAA